MKYLPDNIAEFFRAVNDADFEAFFLEVELHHRKLPSYMVVEKSKKKEPTFVGSFVIILKTMC